MSDLASFWKCFAKYVITRRIAKFRIEVEGCAVECPNKKFNFKHSMMVCPLLNLLHQLSADTLPTIVLCHDEFPNPAETSRSKD